MSKVDSKGYWCYACNRYHRWGSDIGKKHAKDPKHFLLKKKPKGIKHYQKTNYRALCGARADVSDLEIRKSNVTCKRCLAILGKHKVTR